MLKSQSYSLHSTLNEYFRKQINLPLNYCPETFLKISKKAPAMESSFNESFNLFFQKTLGK